MKKKYLLLAVPVIFGYGTLSYASTVGLDRDFANRHWQSGNHENHASHDHEWDHDDHKFDFSKHHWQFEHHENHAKYDHEWSHYEPKYDFKNHIKTLMKNNYHDHNVYLRLCRNDWDDHHYGAGGFGGQGGHHGNHGGHWGGVDGSSGGGVGANAVPIPAAAWLFAPSLIGLLGFKRKKA